MCFLIRNQSRLAKVRQSQMKDPLLYVGMFPAFFATGCVVAIVLGALHGNSYKFSLRSLLLTMTALAFWLGGVALLFR